MDASFRPTSRRAVSLSFAIWPNLRLALAVSDRAIGIALVRGGAG
jgi:hypothetical protein